MKKLISNAACLFVGAWVGITLVVGVYVHVYLLSLACKQERQ